MLVMLTASVSTHAGAATKFDPMDPLGTARKGHSSRQKHLAIEVAPGDWGRANVRDIQMVLSSVADEFLSHIATPQDDLNIRVIPRSGSPRVLYERGPEGQYVIQLTARDDRWFQYVFQFAHELCHVLSNFDHKVAEGDRVVEDNQWFEESLCETASLFALKRLAVKWETSPPTRNWAGYGEMFSAYAARLLNEPHRHLPSSQSFQTWFAENQASLTENPYLREKNEVVATNLLPLFEQHPELWAAVTYLNPKKASAGKPFAQYLVDWYAASPEKTLPGDVLALFGINPEIQSAAVAPEPAPEKVLASAAHRGDTAVNGPSGD
jgi:hypothetical protein